MRHGFVKAIGPDGKTREVPAHYLTNPRLRFRPVAGGAEQIEERTLADPPPVGEEAAGKALQDPDPDEYQPPWASSPSDTEE
ncbi:hypothetical protein BJH93_04140 [Kocuria polaris]|nr:hypothetical protein [Kocuria polaris]